MPGRDNPVLKETPQEARAAALALKQEQGNPLQMVGGVLDGLEQVGISKKQIANGIFKSAMSGKLDLNNIFGGETKAQKRVKLDVLCDAAAKLTWNIGGFIVLSIIALITYVKLINYILP